MTKIIQKINSWHYALFFIFIIYILFYWPYLFGGKILDGGDAESLHYPGISYLKENLFQGKFPFYSERIFAGFPVYENSEFAYLNPIRIIFALLLRVEDVLKAEHVLYFVLGTFGMLGFSKKLKFSPVGYIYSHSVYFYSVQSVARFTHINIIYVYFLLPLCLFFIQKYLDSKDKNIIIMLSLVNALGLYYGNYNAVMISLMAQGIFYLCSVNIKKEFAISAKFVSLFALWLVTITLPIIITSGALYLTSSRGSKEINFSQGTVSGTYLAANFLHPYPYGLNDLYIGNQIKNSWLFHENSIYPGITVLLIGAFAFFLVKEARIKKFFIINFILFLLLATIFYSPFEKVLNFFPLNIFRYWIRYAIIFHLSLALLGGAFLSHLNKVAPFIKKTFIRDFLIFLLPIGLFIFLILYSLSRSTTQVLVDYLVSIFPSGVMYKKTLFPLILSSAILIPLSLKKKSNYLMLVLACIASFDILYFSHMALLGKIRPETNLKNKELYSASEILKNERVVYLDKEIKGNKPLYYKTWGLFGYSVSFEQKNYDDYLANLEMDARRLKEFKPDYLKDLGVYAFINKDGTYTLADAGPDSLFSTPRTSPEIISKDEGQFVLNISGGTDQEVVTKIRNFPGWRLTVNGKKTEFSNLPSDVFLKFRISEGTNYIRLKYIPIHLYYALGLTFVFLCITVIFHRKINFSVPKTDLK